MGIFDLFGSKEARSAEALRKQARKLTEKFGPPENRQKVIDQLGEDGSAAALQTLCMRFTVLAEPTITDQQEKESVLRWLADAGQDAVAPVTAFLHEQESGVAWGLRALAQVAAPAEVLRIAAEELRHLGTVYTRDPEKKLTLLAWVSEHHPGEAAATLEPAAIALLEDFSDDVRIGAARVLAQLPPSEASREGLIALLLRSGDNARVRGEVLGDLHAMKVDVKGHRPAVEALLTEPWFLDKDGLVKRRG